MGATGGIAVTSGVQIRPSFLKPPPVGVGTSTGFLIPSNTSGSTGGMAYGGATGATGLRGATGAVGAARLGATGGGRAGLAGGRAGALSGFGSQLGGGLGAGLGTTNTVLRVPMRIVDELTVPQVPQPPGPPTSFGRFQQRIARMPITGTGTVEVLAVGQTAILRGTVATARHRDLLGRVALLEPGITSVQNELVVTGEGTP
jgi:hypothetical protein